MQIWTVCFILFFVLTQVYQVVQNLSLPMPVMIMGGVLLAIASNVRPTSKPAHSAAVQPRQTLDAETPTQTPKQTPKQVSRPAITAINIATQTATEPSIPETSPETSVIKPSTSSTATHPSSPVAQDSATAPPASNPFRTGRTVELPKLPTPPIPPFAPSAAHPQRTTPSRPQ